MLWWRRWARLTAVAAACFLILAPGTVRALDPTTYDILSTPFYDPSDPGNCSEVSPSAPAGQAPTSLDLKALSGQYKLQSVLVKKMGGDVVGSVNADKSPVAVASVLKLIIAETYLARSPDLSKTTKVATAELYNGPGSGRGVNSDVSDPKAGDIISYKQALQTTLMNSSNTNANVLIDAMGGLDFTASAVKQNGYKDTLVQTYYSPSDTIKPNQTTVTDLAAAMERIFTKTGDSYRLAQQALQAETYTFGLRSDANKWGGTSQVTGNTALFTVGGDRYIISMYTENPWFDSSSGQSASVGYIRNATNEIVNQLKGSGSATPAAGNTSCAASCSTGAASSLDRFLQVVASHEGYNAGDYKAVNPAGAYGRYQYIPTTWQNAAKSYYPPATTYPLASDAPGDIQDTVTYFRFAAMASKFNGSAFKMAVEQYLPAANTNSSLLDQVPSPGAGNTLTVREYANNIVNDINNAKGSDIPLHYKDNPDVSLYLQKNGLTNVPQLIASNNDAAGGQAVVAGSGNFGCGGQAAIVQTALSFSWPDSSHGITPKQEYADAITKYNPGMPAADCGVFVATVMRASGADPDYPKSGTTLQAAYVQSSPRYNVKVGVTSTADLQPGDILIIAGQDGSPTSGHTLIWLGAPSQGQGYNEASASFQERAANLGFMGDLNDARGTYLRARLIR